ncbi:MAG: ferritin [Verrucomicrobia bacterium]|nr:ferritin [Verrucomicrobiota bacterium]
MIDSLIEEALVKQINQEFAAAYNYLGMSGYFDANTLDGFAHWMQTQHNEEMAHGMRLFRYLLDRGGKIDLATIPKPRSDFKGTVDAFEAALEQERENTIAINRLYELATECHDYATKSHLQWFLDEQVEEEKTIEDIIAMLRMAKEDISAILFLNEKLGARKVTNETAPVA